MLRTTCRCPTHHRVISRGSSIIPGSSGNSSRCCAPESTRWLSAEIADALLVHGLRVEEIVSETRRQVHALLMGIDADGTNALLAPPPATMHPVTPYHTAPVYVSRPSPWSHVMDVDVDGTNDPLARVAHRATIRLIN